MCLWRFVPLSKAFHSMQGVRKSFFVDIRRTEGLVRVLGAMAVSSTSSSKTHLAPAD